MNRSIVRKAAAFCCVALSLGMATIAFATSVGYSTKLPKYKGWIDLTQACDARKSIAKSTYATLTITYLDKTKFVHCKVTESGNQNAIIAGPYNCYVGVPVKMKYADGYCHETIPVSLYAQAATGETYQIKCKGIIKFH